MLKSSLFEIFSSLRYSTLRKKFKNVAFSHWGKQWIVPSNCPFFCSLFCESWFHEIFALFLQILLKYLTGMIGSCLLSVQDNLWLTIILRYLTKVVSWRCLEYWSPSSKGLTRVRRGTIFSLKIFSSGISLRDKLWKVV